MVCVFLFTGVQHSHGAAFGDIWCCCPLYILVRGTFISRLSLAFTEKLTYMDLEKKKTKHFPPSPVFSLQ